MVKSVNATYDYVIGKRERERERERGGGGGERGDRDGQTDR